METPAASKDERLDSIESFHRRVLEFAAGKARLELEAVQRAFHGVHPEFTTAAAGRARLREYLDRLQLNQQIELPKGRALWDGSAHPPLPRWIKLPQDACAAERPDLRSIPWAPELRFLATTRVFVPLADLLKIQEFFARGGRTRPLVPIKERSVELFGDEKRLDQLLRGSALFGGGRLEPETLRCFVVAEPLPWTPGLGGAGPVLVIENAATWHSYCRWNAASQQFSAVVYGCGNRFLDGVRSLQDILNALGSPREVLYFGDLDPQGLLIPQEASRRAQAAGLPPIQPHLWSYQRLLEAGAGRDQPWDGEPPALDLCDWLRTCAGAARQLLASGRRLPQELIGFEYLSGANVERC